MTASAASLFTRPGISRLLLVVAVVSLAGCATASHDPALRADAAENNDPAEPTNRAVFSANMALDRNAVRPVARGYRDHLSPAVRDGVHNFVRNLGEPAVAVNDLMQGNFKRCWTTVQRFGINSTIGIAGIRDVATGLDRPAHVADFGQTMGVWGLNTGPSVQLPLFGPSNVRDTVGKVVDVISNPVTLLTGGLGSAGIALAGVGVVDGRANILPMTDTLESNSTDYYVALRSVMAQRREALVADAKAAH